MKGGSTNEAMEDFTGGLTELFDLKDNPPPNLYEIMHKAMERNSLMATSIEVMQTCWSSLSVKDFSLLTGRCKHVRNANACRIGSWACLQRYCSDCRKYSEAF